MARHLKKRGKGNFYKITYNISKGNGMKIIIHPDSGFKTGDHIAQVVRDDGVLEIIPESLFNVDNYGGSNE